MVTKGGGGGEGREHTGTHTHPCRGITRKSCRVVRAACAHVTVLGSFLSVLQVCVASGRCIREGGGGGGGSLRCDTCRHHMLVAELGARVACPLCHSALPRAASTAASAATIASGSSGIMRRVSTLDG